MLYSQGVTPYLAVAVIAYVAFVFFSESFNPFKTPRGLTRFRWRLARALSCIFFIAAVLALYLMKAMPLSTLHAGVFVAAACFFFGLFPVLKYYRAVKRDSKAPAEDFDENDSLNPNSATTVLPADAGNTASASVNPIAANEGIANSLVQPSESNGGGIQRKRVSRLPAVTGSALHVNQKAVSRDAVANTNTNTNTNVVSLSDEHELEKILAGSGDISEFDDLDQTIAEADFHITDFAGSDEFDVAQPDRSSQANGIWFDDIKADEKSSSQSFGSVEAGLTDLPNTQASANDSSTGLLEKITIQEEKIRQITESNQSLQKAREALVDEVAELKFAVKKGATIARKSIAQRDEAVRIKDRALAIATMEQKKRKLTEIKARKALMRMRESLKMLSDQSV